MLRFPTNLSVQTGSITGSLKIAELTGELITDAELAELLDDLTVAEVNAHDLVIVAATFDGGPFDNVIGGGTQRVAHVRLFEHFLEARARLATSEKFRAGDARVVNAIDDFDKTEL